MSEETLIDRLKHAMGRYGVNASALAERANVGSSFVYDILNGKSTNPTTKKLSAIAEVLGVSVSYLLYGSKAFEEAFSATPLASSSDNDILVAIPSISVEKFVGGGAFITDEYGGNPYYFHRSWVKNTLHASPESLRIIFVKGDSMYPTLADNDMVLIDTSRKDPSPPGIFVLFDGIGPVVKRVEYVSKPSESKLRIISDNNQYTSYERDINEVSVIGRVVWFSRKMV